MIRSKLLSGWWTMIKAEDISDEVVEAALSAYSGNSCTCSSCRKAVVRTIAAALNAWPKISTADWGDHGEEFIILPLPQKNRKNDV